jgi:hypothetical protein
MSTMPPSKIPVVWRWQFLHSLLHVEKSAIHFWTVLKGINKGVVELVCAQRVWKFTEVHLECRCNGMYVLKRFLMFIGIWYQMLIKITPVKIKIVMSNITHQSLSRTMHSNYTPRNSLTGLPHNSNKSA